MMSALAQHILLSESSLKTIRNDPEKTATAANLVYVNDTIPGIRRVKKGRKFLYVFRNKPVKNQKTIDRINRLVIPPAWKNVWICPEDNGHLQATGLDTKARKQYKYHVTWSSFRNHTKFYRLLEFGKKIPEIRKRLDYDLSRPGLPPEKVLALVVALMERTSIRVGNDVYEKLYGSFGITTLKDQHVTIRGSEITFMFVGKKGVPQRINLKSKRLSAIVKRCRDIPGKELFQYIDENRAYRKIDSGMVNEYIRNLSGCDFTAKDFRTWTGTVHALIAFRELRDFSSATQAKKNIVTMLDYVATQLGNTRTVCKKYYVHPILVSLYEQKKLQGYLRNLSEIKKCHRHDLACEEKLLLKILKREQLRPM